MLEKSEKCSGNSAKVMVLNYEDNFEQILE